MSDPKNPFDDLVLDDEEQAIENTIERGEYVRASDFEERKKLAEESAKNYLQVNGTKPITLRVRQADLIKIKAKAKQSNIPYQTLLGAVLHDFAEGKSKISI